MNMLAAILDPLETLLVGAVNLLPLLLIFVGISWLFRLIKTMRQRLDDIEDKLDLVLLHLEAAKTKPTSEGPGTEASSA